MAPPFKTAVVDIMYGEGISQLGELLDMAADLDFVKKSGAWYAYNDEKIGQGRENAKSILGRPSRSRCRLEQKVRAHYGIGVAAPVEVEEERTNKFIRLIN